MQLVKLNFKRDCANVKIWINVGEDFNANLNLLNHNNLRPAEPVSRVSETQPEMGENYKLTTNTWHSPNAAPMLD